MDSWWRGRALKHHRDGTSRVTYASFDQTTENPKGMYALSMVTEELRLLPGVKQWTLRGSKSFSALQLVYLGVHRLLQCKGYGKIIMGRVIETFIDAGQKVGIPMLIVFPISDRAAAFYKDLGFEYYDEQQAMFLPLQTAIDAFELER